MRLVAQTGVGRERERETLTGKGERERERKKDRNRDRSERGREKDRSTDGIRTEWWHTVAIQYVQFTVWRQGILLRI